MNCELKIKLGQLRIKEFWKNNKKGSQVINRAPGLLFESAKPDLRFSINFYLFTDFEDIPTASVGTLTDFVGTPTGFVGMGKSCGFVLVISVGGVLIENCAF